MVESSAKRQMYGDENLQLRRLWLRQKTNHISV